MIVKNVINLKNIHIHIHKIYLNMVCSKYHNDINKCNSIPQCNYVVDSGINNKCV